MPKITNRFLRQSKHPEHGQVIYRDSELKGFAVRITPHCKSFIVEARVNRVLRRITLGRCTLMTVEEARLKARTILAGMAEGRDPTIEQARQRASLVTLQQVLDRYLETRALRPSSRRLYRNLVTQRLEDWLSLPVAAINRSMVEKRHREISTISGRWTASKSQANMTMHVLKLLLNFAADYYEIDGKPLLSSNPVKVLSRNKSWHRIPPRQGIIPDHKLSDWYAAINSLNSRTVRDLLLLVLLTGLRHREASTLRFDDVDFDARTLRIRREISKNHKEHRLPLPEFLFELLRKRQSQNGSAYVFPGRKGPMVQIAHSLKQARARSGCHFTVHDCRRTFLTTAEKLGIPYVVLKKLANHSGGNDTTFGYIVVDVERLRVPMEMIAERFLELMNCRNTDESA